MKKPVVVALAAVALLAVAIGGWLWYQSQQDRGADPLRQRGYPYRQYELSRRRPAGGA